MTKLKTSQELRKLPGKSSLNVRFVCPVCPVCPHCPVFPEDSDNHDDQSTDHGDHNDYGDHDDHGEYGDLSHHNDQFHHDDHGDHDNPIYKQLPNVSPNDLLAVFVRKQVGGCLISYNLQLACVRNLEVF